MNALEILEARKQWLEDLGKEEHEILLDEKTEREFVFVWEEIGHPEDGAGSFVRRYLPDELQTTSNMTTTSKSFLYRLIDFLETEKEEYEKAGYVPTIEMLVEDLRKVKLFDQVNHHDNAS